MLFKNHHLIFFPLSISQMLDQWKPLHERVDRAGLFVDGAQPHIPLQHRASAAGKAEGWS